MAPRDSTGINTSVIESALATLQPLRDLSRNWDVDIASCLEEYLHELGAGGLVNLEAHQEQQEQDGQIPNFAHAALILQNSSSVYTRKVDYLHSLVYKALYEFCRSSSQSNKERRKSTTDPDIEEFYEFDPHMEFLLLDDVVPEDHTNQKINLKSDEIDLQEDSSNATPNQSVMTNQNNRTRLSLGGLSVTKLERSITGGFTSSAQQRALLGIINNGSLRLVSGTCDVGDNGVLLMPGSSLLTPASSNDGFAIDQQPRRSLFGEEGAATPPQTTNDDFNNHDDGDDDDGPGFEMNFDNDDDDDGNQVPEQTQVVGLQQQRKKVTFADTKSLRNKPRMDLWALLDPHSNDSKKPKPLRKGKTIRLPQGVDKLPSECVTGARTRQMKQRPRQTILEEDETTVKSLASDTFQSFLRNQFDPPKIPFNGLVFREFSYIAKETAKQRAQERRAERTKQLEQQRMQQPHVYEEDDDDDDDYGGGFDFGGGFDDDNDNDNVGNTGLASLDDAFQNNHAGERDDDNDSTQEGKTFEQLCRAHIQAFAKGAEEFAVSTKLSERVDKWQAKLVPILEEEERRSAFDIHMYFQHVIERAEQGLQRTKRRLTDGSAKSTKSVEFETIAQNCSQSDVCRLFLASLSLANAGNLEIEESAATFRFDLVSSSVESPMGTYKAPSLIEGM